MIVPSQLALKTHTNLACAASFATLDKLVDKFTLPPTALPIGHASLTHVIKLAAHSTNAYCDETIIYNDPVHRIFQNGQKFDVPLFLLAIVLFRPRNLGQHFLDISKKNDVNQSLVSLSDNN
jgi:hypothetical protein